MKNIIIHTMEGLSASSKKESKTLPAVVDKIAIDFKDNIYAKKHFSSKLFDNFYDSARFVFNNVYNIALEGKSPKLLLIGKSMGAVNTFNFFKKYILPNEKCFSEIQVLFIDAHAPIIAGYRGKYRGLTIPDVWRSAAFFWNIYQQNEYPMGCKMHNCYLSERIYRKTVNHNNIICQNEIKSKIIRNLMRLSV